ncbi:hypothetical protein [Winogradskyella immobilis]|uniref:Uncharacterized protein n=1 Tax=Winogradskyella immobilis TaxID=2816852 RepID=A0ABS8EMA9_9FLAO|nr:hypothetical protein [Winogradskyella immobilis]MCC1484061.1 hypothetical protein [Winogradskyella immobilis]MCG0016153.1 hypothetical protein [Winogradskyella immobilis]
MEEQELKNIWKRSSNKEDITINNNQLIVNFKSKMERRESIVRRRDRREAIGAVFGVSYFLYFIIKAPLTISSIGAALMILSMIHVLYQLYRNRKSRFTQNLFLPLKQQLQQQRTFMLRQAKLLNSGVLIMFLPIFISSCIFTWGNYALHNLNHELSDDILTTKLPAKLIATLFMVGVGIYLIRQNKRAAKVNWEPLIKDIDLIIENLDKEK